MFLPFFISLFFTQSYSYHRINKINHCLSFTQSRSSTLLSKTQLNVAPPSTYSKVEKDCLTSLTKFLQTNPSSKRLSVDILTPGLNPKLEQKAILLQEYLFALVYEISLVLSVQFNSVQLLFPSIGDAASYQKYTRLQFLDPPSNIVLADVSLERISPEDDVALFITTRNNVGDPVIRTVQSICETYPQLTAIFLNCDLSDRVTSGMQEKRIRDAFRNSIRVCYYFRNLVQISRPSMTPYELGCLRYAPEQGWEIYALNEGDVTAMGSLNRYMKQGSFRRNDNSLSMASGSSGTSNNKNTKIYRNAEIGADTLTPPRFILAKRYDKSILTIPSRDDIDNVVTSTLARAERDRETKKKAKSNSNNNNNNNDVDDDEEEEEDEVKVAQRLIYDLAKTGSTPVDANTLLSACRTLCTAMSATSATSANAMSDDNDLLLSGIIGAEMSMNDIAGLDYTNTSTSTARRSVDVDNSNNRKIDDESSTSGIRSKNNNINITPTSSSSSRLYEGVWESIIEMNCRHVEKMALFMRPFTSATGVTGGSGVSDTRQEAEGLMECGLSGESVECYDVDNAVYQLNYLVKSKLIIHSMKNEMIPSSSSSISGNRYSTGTLERKQEINTLGGLMKMTTSTQSYQYYDLSSSSSSSSLSSFVSSNSNNQQQQQQGQEQLQASDDWLAGKLLLLSPSSSSSSSSSGIENTNKQQSQSQQQLQGVLDVIWVLPSSSSSVITIALTHESNEPIPPYSLPTMTATSTVTSATTAAATADSNTNKILFPLLPENKIITQQLQQQPDQILHRYVLWKRID